MVSYLLLTGAAEDSSVLESGTNKKNTQLLEEDRASQQRKEICILFFKEIQTLDEEELNTVDTRLMSISKVKAGFGPWNFHEIL